MFENTSDSRFPLWEVQKYKEVKQFIKKLYMCDIYAIPLEEITTYESLIKEAMHVYHELVNSKQW